MAQAIIAFGSNLGDRTATIQSAISKLETLSTAPLIKSSIWESEPVGPSEHRFLNGAIVMTTSLPPHNLLTKLKDIEQQAGRSPKSRHWGPRELDLDIIGYDNLVIETETLILPHPEYTRRLFVLLPMQEIVPEWIDPKSNHELTTLIRTAPSLDVQLFETNW